MNDLMNKALSPAPTILLLLLIVLMMYIYGIKNDWAYILPLGTWCVHFHFWYQRNFKSH
jgi:hypothetical protein